MYIIDGLSKKRSIFQRLGGMYSPILGGRADEDTLLQCMSL